MTDQRIYADQQLLANVKSALPELKKLLDKDVRWAYEDMIYRFYHHSFKVYGLQGITVRIAETLKKLAPEGVDFNPWFEKIFAEGTGKQWEASHNSRWLVETRPILEAFFHAKYFLEMAIHSGEALDKAPNILPSEWAGLLYFYNMR